MMMKGEREELAKVVCMRAKLARAETDAQGARLMADFESQLARQYPENNPVWADITAAARQAVAEADRQIAQLCQELGVPQEFRPKLDCYWSGRGENACKIRRAELRAMAKVEVAARIQAAKLEIDRQSADLATELVAGGLESEHARAFLERLPTAEELMPRMGLAEMETRLLASSGGSLVEVFQGLQDLHKDTTEGPRND